MNYEDLFRVLRQQTNLAPSTLKKLTFGKIRHTCLIKTLKALITASSQYSKNYSTALHSTVCSGISNSSPFVTCSTLCKNNKVKKWLLMVIGLFQFVRQISTVWGSFSDHGTTAWFCLWPWPNGVDKSDVTARAARPNSCSGSSAAAISWL